MTGLLPPLDRPWLMFLYVTSPAWLTALIVALVMLLVRVT